mgnify:FL=1
MRIITFLSLILISANFFSQSSQIDIDWFGEEQYNIGNLSLIVPNSKNFKNNYSYGDYYKIVKQWESDKIIDESSVQISNIIYTDIDVSEYNGLEKINFSNEANFRFNSSISKNKIFSFLELEPIIFADGKYKIVESFVVNYSFLERSKNNKNSIQSSVMRNGDWYQFFIQESGIHKIDRNFLENLGINTESIDPRKIKIFGHGGEMLTMQNTENFLIDPFENSIKITGEEDGSFDSDDYILFYASGPGAYNSENNTNLNLYEDKISYFLSIGSEDGLRISDLLEPDGETSFSIDYYTNYQFHENDDYNLAKIGRRWFGDRFDYENIKTFSFDIDNLIVDQPVKLKISAAATSEIVTSMSVELNGTQLSTMVFGSIGDPILATGDSFSSNINLNSSQANITLTYNNNGNPASSAYLDFISIEAISGLNFNGGQLIFYNDDLDFESEIVSYQISNSSNILSVWDISDLSNVLEITHNQESNLTFKSVYSSSNRFVAYDGVDFYTPTVEDNSQISNQNLKENIFLNSLNEIEPVDYIIIARSDMLFEAERLANINRDVNGLNVKVVELQKIYNEFSSGNQDISAIRNFIRYVYNNSNNNNSLKYLCLFGDASYDYKNRIPNNTNIIPSWNSLNSFSLSSSYVSDDFFGMMDIAEGTMTNSNKLDIAVGRILADSNSRAKDLVDKIETYYSQNSFSDWRNKIIVVSDDVDEPWENIIQSTSNNIADLITENKPFFNAKKILADAFNQETSSGGERYPEVKSQLINGMKQGALVVNYFGHGGEDGLARERIFDKIDAVDITNDKFNCFVSVTCEFTKFDNPNRETAGEYLYWNKNGGSIALITTTRQIFVSVGVNFNLTLENYLFSLDSDSYTTMAEALRLTKIDPSISNSDQRRLVFFIGDPAMKLSIPEPQIIITRINDIPIDEFESNISGLDLVNIKGNVLDSSGQIIDNYQGELTATVYDKEIERSTLGNDGTTDNSGNPILLDFKTLGETLFRGKSSISNGEFEFNFVVPRDVGMQVDFGKFSFYSKENNSLQDKNGYDLSVLMGGINENADEDNIGPEIELFMNDESFINGGITNENPNLIVKLFDENGINTSSGVGHDIIATIDSNQENSYVLNDYYEANIDDFQNGTINFPLSDISPGSHTLRLKAWDVYNNSSESEIEFTVFDEDQDLVIENVLNYPNPFINYTEFWFNHNSSTALNVTIQVFTISGKLVKTILGTTESFGNNSFSRDFYWDGRDDYGDKVAKGVYIYKLNVRSESLNKSVSKIEKLVIL